jgi:hypothetical protein
VGNTFTIDNRILEKNLRFVSGKWPSSSYIAAGIENVLTLIKVDNSDKNNEYYLNS